MCAPFLHRIGYNQTSLRIRKFGSIEKEQEEFLTEKQPSMGGDPRMDVHLGKGSQRSEHDAVGH